MLNAGEVVEKNTRSNDYLIEFLKQEAPCDLCEYRWTCRKKDMTCQSFRDYVIDADPAERKDSWAWPRKPDKLWANSFYGM